MNTGLAEALPVDWSLMTLKDVAKWGSGGTPKATNPAYYGGEFPWAVIGDLDDQVVGQTAKSITKEGLEKSSAKLVEPGALLIAMYGSIGKLGIVGTRMATNQAIAFAYPDETLVRPKYLFWYLMSQRANLATAGKGATQSNISQTVLKAWPIPIPPIDEQRRIVEAIETYLSHLDAGVESLQRAKRNVERMRSAVLHAAVSGDLASESDDGESAHVMKERLLNERPRAWERARTRRYKEPASPRDEIQPPAGWVSMSIDQLSALITKGTTPTTLGFEYQDEGVLFVKAESLENGVIRHEACAFIGSDADEELARSRLNDGDVLVTIAGTLGRIGLVRSGDLPANTNQAVALVRLVDPVVGPFIRMWLRSPLGRQSLLRQGRGVGLQNLNLRQIAETQVCLPAPDQQWRILTEVEAKLSVLNSIGDQVETGLVRVGGLRRAVLGAAFDGRLIGSNIPTAIITGDQQIVRSGAAT